MKYRYSIGLAYHDRVFEEGEINALTPARACLKLEKKFKEDVLDRGVKLAVSLYHKGKRIHKQRYEAKPDFRKNRLAEFRRRVSRKQHGSREPRYYFVAIGQSGELVLTKLASKLSERPTWLTRRKKRLLGPYTDKAEAQHFMDLMEMLRDRETKLTLNGRDYGSGRPREQRLYKRDDRERAGSTPQRAV